MESTGSAATATSVADQLDVAEALEDLDPPPPPKKKRVRAPKLVTVDQVRRQAARLYALALAGEITASDASRLASVLAIALRCSDRDIDDRLAQLEERFRETAP